MIFYVSIWFPLYLIAYNLSVQNIINSVKICLIQRANRIGKPSLCCEPSKSIIVIFCHCLLCKRLSLHKNISYDSVTHLNLCEIVASTRVANLRTKSRQMCLSKTNGTWLGSYLLATPYKWLKQPLALAREDIQESGFLVVEPLVNFGLLEVSVTVPSGDAILQSPPSKSHLLKTEGLKLIFHKSRFRFSY